MTCSLILVSQSLAQPKTLDNNASPNDNFGSETVDPLTKSEAGSMPNYRDAHSALPLAVELVEESAEGQIPSLTKDLQGDQDNPNQNNADQNDSQLAANPTTAQSELNDSTLKKTTTVLNVTDVEIDALIKTFSKLTGRNYIIDSTVKGKVTILLPSAVTIAEALRVFDTVLLLKGFTTVPTGDNIWKVIPAKDAKQTTIPLMRYPDPTSDALVTQLVRFKHISAEDAQQLLQQFISKEGLIQTIGGSNSIIIIDSPSNLQRLKELTVEIDVPAVDQEITIIPIVHADAVDIAEKINQILGEKDDSSSGSSSSVARALLSRTSVISRSPSGLQGQPGQVGASGARRALPLKIIPDERTNSLIVVADPELTLKVQALAEQLDSELDRSSGRFWVYRLQHAGSEELAEILNSLISGAGETESGSGSGSRNTQGSSLSTRRNQPSLTTPSTPQDRLAQAIASRRTQLARGATGGSPDGGRVSLEGEVSIANDPSTNSLIINASKSDYLRLKEVIDELDIKRRQVLVEATILEVGVTGDEGMGVELRGSTTIDSDKGALVGQTNFGGLNNILANPTALTDLTIAAVSSGTITLPGGITIPSQAVLINAVSSHQNVNVLSSPTILAMDNEEAEIIVGENVPFVTSTSTDSTNINNTFNQIERQDVGITLRITPQISTGDFVILKIFVEISNVVAGTRNDPNGPTTTIRTTETTVEVRDNQMIITGGLLADAVTDAKRGVPFWDEIPVIGQWFKRTDTNSRRTNLLLFITPRVIVDQFDARDETRGLADKLEDQIYQLDSNPNRGDVLRNEDIDNVVTALDGADRIKPTTIRPSTNSSARDANAEAAIRRTEERLQQLQVQEQEWKSEAVPNNSSRSGEQRSSKPAVRESEITEEVIDITVAPKLPGSSENSTAGSAKQSTNTGARPRMSATLPKAPQANEPRKANATTSAPQRTSPASSFVVLRKIEQQGVSSGIPLPVLLNGVTPSGEAEIGLVVDDSEAAAEFGAGKRYTITTNSGKETLVCLGKYRSQDEAKLIHPELTAAENWRQTRSR